ncbi:uncharacterized protein CC84DRAFT_1089157 [Paraphaeosphaeria sporulosa]|uniref:BTB domain-containing protein n=1 Tax=Paraphaeosphaeria sporulosa TaxID=1460663 RepID=A0A177CHI6_9PLEO|nr:uncharacterized protein CC84DRAFT_1089157 [Paraphaeosphaeria sporulosa]OAG07025.1 hypothetical protein CC84DRAFT_1089157 [Paraphaeosphaeria sporulosa]
MAAENFIRDISTYLTAGNFSDLTLQFGERTWKIHKAIACCHSKWFHNVMTIGFKVSTCTCESIQETETNVITLEDDGEMADALDCMVSYFYEAGYDTSKYSTPGTLLHAQVAVVADKYDCPSLYKLASASFAKQVPSVKSDDWIDIAALIYDYTTLELTTHSELRSLVINSVLSRPDMLTTILEKDTMVDILRSNADLATDLLLARPKTRDTSEHLFMCDKCQYVHAGPRDCAYIESRNGAGMGRACPNCGVKDHGPLSKRYYHKVFLAQGFPCSSCGGTHTTEPAPEPQSSMMDVQQ